MKVTMVKPDRPSVRQIPLSRVEQNMTTLRQSISTCITVQALATAVQKPSIQIRQHSIHVRANTPQTKQPPSHHFNVHLLRMQIVSVILLTHTLGAGFCPGRLCDIGHQHRLYHDLLVKNGYVKELRPVIDERNITVVKFGIAVRQIVRMDQRNQVLISNVWTMVDWTDELMRWTPSEYGGVDQIIIPTDKIWVPDITLYNNADEKYSSQKTIQGLAKISNKGQISLEAPAILKSSCRLDVTYFPFDEQKCTMKFGSWAYNGDQLDLQNMSDNGDQGYYVDNGEWQLLELPVNRTITNYNYPDGIIPFIDLTFTIHLKRRSMFYVINLLLPCIMITALTLLDFNLPCESGEKVTLGITILLSLTVFLLLVVEQMPPTSDSFPWIGKYFSITLLLVCISTSMTVMVLNIHYARHRTVEPPRWLRILVFKYMWFFNSYQRRVKTKYQLATSSRSGGSSGGGSHKSPGKPLTYVNNNSFNTATMERMCGTHGITELTVLPSPRLSPKKIKMNGGSGVMRSSERDPTLQLSKQVVANSKGEHFLVHGNFDTRDYPDEKMESDLQANHVVSDAVKNVLVLSVNSDSGGEEMRQKEGNDVCCVQDKVLINISVKSPETANNDLNANNMVSTSAIPETNSEALIITTSSPPASDAQINRVNLLSEKCGCVVSPLECNVLNANYKKIPNSNHPASPKKKKNIPPAVPNRITSFVNAQTGIAKEQSSCCQVEFLLAEILTHIEVFSKKVEAEDARQDKEEEWKEIAWVIDRCFMWLFLFITVSSTSIILLKASRLI